MTAPRTSPSGGPVRQPVLLGLFAGAGVGVGYLLAGVPGVELMTLVAALAGITLGPWRGALAGGLAALVYSVGSPYGVPLPPLLAAQVVGMATAALLGTVLGRFLLFRPRSRRTAAVAAGTTGLAAAFLFDLLTNLAIVVAYDLAPVVVLSGAVPMFLLHVTASTLIFAAVVPMLVPRLANLARGTLVGRSAAPVLLLALVAAAVPVGAAAASPPDSLSVVPHPPAETALDPVLDPHGAQAVMGWQRPVWNPFAWTALDWLNWRSPRVTATEAGIGGAALVLGEAGTSPTPLITVEGAPWGTGHALVDSPWLIPTQGIELAGQSWLAPGESSAGRLEYAVADSDPQSAVSRYRGVKGRHESYMRGFHVLTPRAAWRVGFAFEEVIDNEAWDYSDPEETTLPPSGVEFPGHGKVRQSRTTLERRLDPENIAQVEFSTARLTRDDVPAWKAEHREIWHTGVTARLVGGSGGVAWRGQLHWRDRDIVWGDRPLASDAHAGRRKLESSREGVSLELRRRHRPPAPAAGDSLAPPPVGMAARSPWLRLGFTRWRVEDSADTLAVATIVPDPVGGSGRTADVAVGAGHSWGPVRLEGSAAGAWDSYAGVAPRLALALGHDAPQPAWRLEIARDGRAPRSDELLTPVERAGGESGTLLLLPNRDLDHEETVRAGVQLGARILGNEIAVDASWRRLRHGVAWTPLDGEADVGRWTNGLEMDATRLTARFVRRGRLLGWGRLLVEGTWQTFDEKQGLAPMLPPETSARAGVFWENHWFQEDGILQLGLMGNLRGTMDDPWDVSRSTRLPERSVLDLFVGFRLVGVKLSLAFRNLTGARVRMSRGTWSSGQELDLRLDWTFRY